MTDSDGRSDRGVEAAFLEERAEDLYEHAPCGYLSTLPDGTLARVNQTLLEWTGHRRDALIGQARFQSLLTVGSQIYYETHYAPLLQMQGRVDAIALEMVCADGRILPVLINARQKRDAAGAVLFNRITVFDATDRRRYERELLVARRKAEQVARDKADLINMLSHDIRNPLNALMGVVQLLDRGELPEGQRRFVRILQSSSENMLNLLNKVLELSKAESSSFALTETSFSLRELVDDVIATFETGAREKGIQLRRSVDERVPAAVIGDPVALRQILANLVGNAVKFTSEGSVSVGVDARHLGTDSVTLDVAVADTGIGIAAEGLDAIFNEFTQASYETAMQFGGSGLGLAITRKLLALYGSSVHVTSAPGAGATFSFQLRLALPPSHG
jgi:PAS domain S-box-containing protein